MTAIIPTIGRVVWYVLSDMDAKRINRDRVDDPAPLDDVKEGDTFPAIVVKTHGDTPDSYVNLKVLLDGPDMYWAKSVRVGEEPGSYHWMPYQKSQAAKHA